MKPDWEDAHFYLAKYYDKIMNELVHHERPDKKGEFYTLLVGHLRDSLCHGMIKSV